MPLGKRTDCGDAKYAGCAVDFTTDPSQQLQVRFGVQLWGYLGYTSSVSDSHLPPQAALQSGFDFITAPLADPAYQRLAASASAKGAQQPDFSVHNLLLISSKCSSQVQAKLS